MRGGSGHEQPDQGHDDDRENQRAGNLARHRDGGEDDAQERHDAEWRIEIPQPDDAGRCRYEQAAVAQAQEAGRKYISVASYVLAGEK